MNLRLISGPFFAALSVGLCVFWGQSPEVGVTVAVTIWCALWWVLEPVPVPVTSLLPFVAFPLAGILSEKEVATAYGHWLILLLLGGFMLSAAMERSGAHRRLAVALVGLVGGNSGRRVVLGFMLATALCSMWISNTATTLMMLPVAMAVIGDRTRGGTALRVPLLLGIAYAASIGGLGTPIGTPPNVILMGVYKEVTGVDIGFLEWMSLGIPAVCVLLPIAWLWLTRGDLGSVRLSMPEVGQWTVPEKRVLIVFACTALLWMSRTAPFGGWSGAFGLPEVGDSTVALAAVMALFVVPDGRGEALLDWDTAKKVPWGLLLLFGGGIAIARAFGASGLSAALGDWIASDLGIATLPYVVTVLALCLFVTFLTEVTSNTATTTLLMPILAAAAASAALEPKLLMVPAALSASCAFMLPVATAPNAIVYGSGVVTTRRMAAEGFVLNCVGAVSLTALSVWWLG